MDRPWLSVVIPVFNEAPSLELLAGELFDVAGAHGYALELIFVDDGSSDGSWDVVSRLAQREPRVRGIRFRRNFGKAAALRAGFDTARGRWICTLDADLQDDPAEIPRLLAQLEGGFDVVSGWKRTRHDPWHKVIPSRIFNALVGWLTGLRLHDHNCGLKAYRREVFDEVRLYGEMHRFIPVLAHARGFRVGEIEVNHRPRRFGHSKYGPRRILKGFLDLLTVTFLTGFGRRPQHFLGTVGLVCFAIGGMGLVYLAGYWITARLHPEWRLLPLHQRPAVLYSLGALLLGGQLMSIGFLAELITAHEARSSDIYSIWQQTFDRQESPPGSGHGDD